MRSAQPRRLAFPLLGCGCNWASRRLVLWLRHCPGDGPLAWPPVRWWPWSAATGAGFACPRRHSGRGAGGLADRA